jgi:LppX_LprAFG lipoprotein
MLSISLTVAGLCSVLANQVAYAQTVNASGGRGAGTRAGVSTFHPAQTNPTPEITPTPTATATPTSTPMASPTSTAAPTATPTTQAPGASRLLTAARAALKSVNTNHFDVKEKVNLGGLVVGAIREQGDSSLRPSELKGHVTGSLAALGKPQKVDEHHVQIGKKAWVKSTKTKGRWKSEKATSPTASGSLQNPLNLVKGSGLKITGLRTVGAEKFGTIPVWHIHGTVIAQVTQTITTKGTVDFLVARTGALPYRILEYVNDPKDALLLDLRVTLSGFGKKVTVTTPKIGGTLQ